MFAVSFCSFRSADSDNFNDSVKMSFKVALVMLLVCWCVAREAQATCSCGGRNGGTQACMEEICDEPEQPVASVEDSPRKLMDMRVEQRNKAARDFLQMKRKLYKTKE